MSQLQFFAGNAPDGLRVGLQILLLALERGIFLVQALEFATDFLDFLLLAAHGQESVSPKNIVDQQHQYKNAQQVPPIFMNELGKSLFETGLHASSGIQSPVSPLRILLHVQDRAIQLSREPVSKHPLPSPRPNLLSVRRMAPAVRSRRSTEPSIARHRFG